MRRGHSNCSWWSSGSEE